MNADIKKLWVEALRSGKYEQGMARLHRASGAFCCLGVLCDLAVKAEVIPPPSRAYCGAADEHYIYDGSAAYLPDSVATWAALETQGVFTTTLVSYNDTRGYSFEQIANIIEEQA